MSTCVVLEGERLGGRPGPEGLFPQRPVSEQVSKEPRILNLNFSGYEDTFVKTRVYFISQFVSLIYDIELPYSWLWECLGQTQVKVGDPGSKAPLKQARPAPAGLPSTGSKQRANWAMALGPGQTLSCLPDKTDDDQGADELAGALVLRGKGPSP